MDPEKRRFSRVVFNIHAELTVNDMTYEVERIIDLSVGGCQLELDEPVPEKSNCSLRIVLNPADRRTHVVVDGIVVRSQDNRFAIQFTGIDPDSLEHLQNVIRYNAQDPERIEEEIDKRPGLI